jgi:hypothetical protein
VPGRYAPDVTELKFLKSSYCGSGACVEVDLTSAAPDVLVRDSKDLSIPALRFTADEWAAFVAGVKAGELDV